MSQVSPQTVKPLPYLESELLNPVPRSDYSGDSLRLISFPMGGIGTGCIGLSGTGKLIDWQIFNEPNIGYQPYYSFLSLWIQKEGEIPVFKVLEGPLTERLDGPLYLTEEMYQWEINGMGPQAKQGSTLPRMRQVAFEGKFPFGMVSLSDPAVPVEVKVEGWNPFIPGDADNSSLPVAILNVYLRNTSTKAVKGVLAAQTQNRAGLFNRMVKEDGLNVMYMTEEAGESGKSMFIATGAPVTTWQTNWKEGGWWVALQHLMNTFIKDGNFDNKSENGYGNMSEEPFEAGNEDSRAASIGIPINLNPGETIKIPVVYGWFFPQGSWGKNYYAVQWDDGLSIARYVLSNLPELEMRTRNFQTSFFSSTLPGTVLEAVSSNLSILRSPTVVRFEDGMLYGWEGYAYNKRLGYGTCNHVWNYQQTVPFLFPELQRSVNENFLNNGLRESDGAIHYRMPAKYNVKPDLDKAFTAADGQFGQVCWVYRDFCITGDMDWLKAMWPKTRKALEYAWTTWDKDKDGLLEGSHHNTLDLNFETPETMCGSLYQAALLAGEKMANLVGDTESATEFRKVFEKGKINSDTHLYNGQYYHQMKLQPGMIDDKQLLNGCISEQIHGQLYARMLGLEDIYQRDHLHTAIGNVFKYNYREDFWNFINAYRAFSVGDDRGLVIATWPGNDRPEFPLLYCDETMTGYEYQVAGNLLYEGYLLEGLTIIKSIRDRYDGKKRNPFCEFEWGNHYARSLAVYNAMLALSGFRYDGYEKMVRLVPEIHPENFNVFFAVESGWGNISQTRQKDHQTIEVDVKEGNLGIAKLNLYAGDKLPVNAFVLINETRIECEIRDAIDEAWDGDKMCTVTLSKQVMIKDKDRFIVHIKY